MRQKRAKTYRKLMHLYSMSFGFRQPYQTLGLSIVSTSNCIVLIPSSVDSEMCKIAVDSKLDLTKQLTTVLQGNIKPSESSCAPATSFAERLTSWFSVITQCCIHELYLQGKVQQPAIDLAKTFERRKCNHREAIPGEECLVSVVGAPTSHPTAPSYRI